MFEKKVWGSVWHLFTSHSAAVSHLKLKAGFCCSRHKHLERANQFSVISGRVAIQQWDKFDDMTEVILESGNSLTVPSGVIHRFRVLQSGTMVEVYWPDVACGWVRLDDIERLDEGGVDDDS